MCQFKRELVVASKPGQVPLLANLTQMNLPNRFGAYSALAAMPSSCVRSDQTVVVLHLSQRICQGAPQQALLEGLDPNLHGKDIWAIEGLRVALGEWRNRLK